MIIYANSAVRAVTWGEGNQLFVTASDPFHTREFGAISIFDFPSKEVLSTSKFSSYAVCHDRPYATTRI